MKLTQFVDFMESRGAIKKPSKTGVVTYTFPDFGFLVHGYSYPSSGDPMVQPCVRGAMLGAMITIQLRVDHGVDMLQEAILGVSHAMQSLGARMGKAESEKQGE